MLLHLALPYLCYEVQLKTGPEQQPPQSADATLHSFLFHYPSYTRSFLQRPTVHAHQFHQQCVPQID